MNVPQPGEAIVVCSRWSAEWIANGGKPIDCHYCGASLVISPSSQELREEKPEVQPCCGDCVSKSEGANAELRFTPAIEKELEAISGISAKDFLSVIDLLEISPYELLQIIKAKEERRQDS